MLNTQKINKIKKISPKSKYTQQLQNQIRNQLVISKTKTFQFFKIQQNSLLHSSQQNNTSNQTSLQLIRLMNHRQTTPTSPISSYLQQELPNTDIHSFNLDAIIKQEPNQYMTDQRTKVDTNFYHYPTDSDVSPKVQSQEDQEYSLSQEHRLSKKTQKEQAKHKKIAKIYKQFNQFQQMIDQPDIGNSQISTLKQSNAKKRSNTFQLYGSIHLTNQFQQANPQIIQINPPTLPLNIQKSGLMHILQQLMQQAKELRQNMIGKYGQAHFINDNNKKVYTCSYCGKPFDKASGLGGHISKIHSKKRRNENNMTTVEVQK